MLLVVPWISGGSAACSCISGFLGQFIPFWESLSSLSCARSMAYSFPTLVLAFLGGIENKPNFSSPISSLVIAVAIVAPSIFSFVISFSSVQSLSCVRLLRPHEPQHTRPPCPSPTPGVHPNPCPLSRWCHPTISSSVVPFSSCPPSFPASGSFLHESALRIKWLKCWCFGFNIHPSNKHPGLISFRMDWLDLLAVQGTLKSLLQHHSSKASILLHSAFFIVHLSHPYMTTGKTIALTKQLQFSSVQSLSHVQLFVTPWNAALQASLSITTPRLYSNSGPLSQWCHPTISSSVVPFSSCPQSFQASGSFQMSQLFASGGQSIGVSASTSVHQWTPRTDLL